MEGQDVRIRRRGKGIELHRARVEAVEIEELADPLVLALLDGNAIEEVRICLDRPILFRLRRWMSMRKCEHAGSGAVDLELGCEGGKTVDRFHEVEYVRECSRVRLVGIAHAVDVQLPRLVESLRCVAAKQVLSAFDAW